jgi:hypothetical protein
MVQGNPLVARGGVEVLSYTAPTGGSLLAWDGSGPDAVGITLVDQVSVSRN